MKPNISIHMLKWQKNVIMQHCVMSVYRRKRLDIILRKSIVLKLRSEDDLSDVRINDDLIVLSHSV